MFHEVAQQLDLQRRHVHRRSIPPHLGAAEVDVHRTECVGVRRVRGIVRARRSSASTRASSSIISNGLV
jgi:hypothetical protein